MIGRTRAAPPLLGLVLSVALLLLTTRSVAGSLPAYRLGLETGGGEQATGLSQSELQSVMRRVLDYSFGRRPDLQFTMPSHSLLAGQPAFTQQELDHMVDVRLLFRTVLRVHLLAWLLLAALGAATLRSRQLWDGARLWRGTARWAAGWGLGVLLVIGAFAAVDFHWAWDQFHYVFFANDLWQLPADSLLILLLPPYQFAKLGAVIGAGWGISLAACLWVGRRPRSGSGAGPGTS